MSFFALLAVTGGCGSSMQSPAPMRLDPAASIEQASCSTDVRVPAFEFRSGFWLNLHNFLFKEAKRLAGIDDDAPGARGFPSALTFGRRPLSPADERRWQAALEFYDEVVLGKQLGDSLVIRVNDRLAQAGNRESLGDISVDPSLRAVLHDVAPIYRDVWWPDHDRANARWMAAVDQLATRYGGCLFSDAARVFHRPWSASIVPVEATVYANWFGAYTSVIEPRITMSSNAVGNQETYGLEGLLHEAVHAHRLLEPLDSALRAETAAARDSLPGTFGHLVLFYTAGALVQRAIPTHVPYADRFGTWRQSTLAGRFRDALACEWQPYLEGRVAFRDAVAALARAAARARAGSRTSCAVDPS